MNISKLHYISQGKTPQDHLNNIQQACMHGAELVQLRIKNKKKSIVLETAKKAREITANYQTRLIINDDYKIAKEVRADGVHLGKTDACPKEAKVFLGNYYLVGGTANTLQDCEALIKKGVDYIGLGPFRFTKTKDNLSPLLGLNGYQAIIDELKTETPIIAIGGITIEDVQEIINTGVYGIAISGELTKNFRSLPEFNKILQTPATQEQVWKFKKD